MRSRSATVAAARARISSTSRSAISASADRVHAIEAGGRTAFRRAAIAAGARM